MELITAFATIVGLLGVYKGEVRDQKAADFDRYIDWLRRQEHGKLVDMILANEKLCASLRDLVEDQHGEVISKLKYLDRIISGIAKHIGGFKPLAVALYGNAGLSDQAVSILQQLNQANTGRFYDLRSDAGYQLQFADTSGYIKYSEQRFVEDDLLRLCEYGLLRFTTEKRGDGHPLRMFTITREGADVGR